MLITYANQSQEQEARAYCHGLGLDPDEMVSGVNRSGFGHADRVTMERWRWYIGVSEAALRRSY